MDTTQLKELEEYLDEIYVRIKDCNEKHEALNTILSNDDKRLALVVHDIEVIKESVSNFKKFGWSVLGALATQIILMIVNYVR